jgi:outer membrane beta-barrel protein
MLKLSILALTLLLVFTSKTHAGEESLYDFLWLDPDKKVYVLQNKLYKKEHSVYFDLGYISNFTSKFQDTSGFSGKLGYYFHEEWGIEGFYHQYNNTKNDDYKNIQAVDNVDPFVRKLNSTYGAILIYSPFYGKINTFNRIFYFDWSFGAGYAKINAESNRKTVGAGQGVRTTYDNESYSGAIAKSKLTFHVSENIHLGLEYMNTYYMAPGPKKKGSDKLRTNTDLIFSVGFSY